MKTSIYRCCTPCSVEKSWLSQIRHVLLHDLKWLEIVSAPECLSEVWEEAPAVARLQVVLT